jgi:hypothetical protein
MASMRVALSVVLSGLAIGHAVLAAPADARLDLTVQAVLPGCRSLVATLGVPGSSEAAFCNGLIDALLYLGELLPPDFCYAVPLDIPRVRIVEAIVDEIEPLFPTVRAQDFRALAVEVLQNKWPCH